MPHEPIKPGWLTPKEVEAQYGIGESTLRLWHKKGVISRELIGKASFYREDEVQKAIELSKRVKGKGE